MEFVNVYKKNINIFINFRKYLVNEGYLIEIISLNGYFGELL